MAGSGGPACRGSAARGTGSATAAMCSKPPSAFGTFLVCCLMLLSPPPHPLPPTRTTFLVPLCHAEEQVREAQRAANEAAGTLAGSPPLGTGEGPGPFGQGGRRAQEEPDPRVGQYRGASGAVQGASAQNRGAGTWVYCSRSS